MSCGRSARCNVLNAFMLKMSRSLRLSFYEMRNIDKRNPEIEGTGPIHSIAHLVSNMPVVSSKNGSWLAGHQSVAWAVSKKGSFQDGPITCKESSFTGVSIKGTTWSSQSSRSWGKSLVRWVACSGRLADVLGARERHSTSGGGLTVSHGLVHSHRSLNIH